jgi:hypothetical protein
MNEQDVVAIEVEEIPGVEEVEDIQEAEEGYGSAINKHCSKIQLPIAKGKNKGKIVLHFKCNYCSKSFVGPSNSSFTTHVKEEHPKKCREIMQKKDSSKPSRDFFNKRKLNLPFDQDVFDGKLLKLIIELDLPFSLVDTDQFGDVMQYLKKDVTVISRRTLMRRLDEVYYASGQNATQKMRKKFDQTLMRTTEFPPLIVY